MKKFDNKNIDLYLNSNSRNRRIVLILERISNDIYYFKYKKRKSNVN